MSSQISLITFLSIHHLLFAEEILKKENYSVQILPLPSGINSFCTKGLAFDADKEKDVQKILYRNNIAVEGFHRLTQKREISEALNQVPSKLIYLNNAATSFPKPKSVYQAVRESFKIGSSPQRSQDLAGDRILYDARKSLAKLFHLNRSYQIIFTFNATDSLNLALLGLLKPGDHLITSSLEHNSVIRPLLYLKKKGISFTKILTTPEGKINLKEIERSLRKNTKLFVFTHASNVIGTLLPIEEIGEIAKKHKIIFLLDAAQTAGSYPIDLSRLNIDLLAFTGHKSLFGLPGTGGLIIREGINLTPLRFGGTGSQTKDENQPEVLPDKYESGTPNLPGIIGLSQGIEFILKEGLLKVRKKEIFLTETFLSGLRKIKDIVLYGPEDSSQQMPVISFNLKGYSPSEVGALLERKYGIISRAGLHCSPWAHQTVGTYPSGTVRFSPGYFNTEEEIDALVNSLKELTKKVFRV